MVGEQGAKLNQLPVTQISYLDNDLDMGTYYYSVTAVGEGQESAPSNQVQGVVTKNKTLFLRGNCNGDRALDLSDAIFSLSFLFSGSASPKCMEACNSNAAGGFDISDPIYTLTFLFSGGSPPGRFPECEISAGDCAEAACPGH